MSNFEVSQRKVMTDRWGIESYRQGSEKDHKVDPIKMSFPLMHSGIKAIKYFRQIILFDGVSTLLIVLNKTCELYSTVWHKRRLDLIRNAALHFCEGINEF